MGGAEPFQIKTVTATLCREPFGSSLKGDNVILHLQVHDWFVTGDAVVSQGHIDRLFWLCVSLLAGGSPQVLGGINHLCPKRYRVFG